MTPKVNSSLDLVGMAAHGAEPTGFAAPHPTGFATPQSTGFATPQSTGFATPQRPLPAPEGGKQRTPSGESGYVIMSPGVSGQYYLSYRRYYLVQIPCTMSLVRPLDFVQNNINFIDTSWVWKFRIEFHFSI